VSVLPDNRRFTLARRPKGMPVNADFALVTEHAPELQDGQFLLRNHYASLDPAMRGWMDDKPSYFPPIPLGHPIPASTIGIVEESRNDDFPVGCWASGFGAIEEYTLHRKGSGRQIDPGLLPSVTNYLFIASGVGPTAYFALLDVGRPLAGETVLVTGAAGAVGSLVGQIAKLKGCRTVGIAGGARKCERLLRDYGYDAAIDYKGKSPEELVAAIRGAAPDGVDIQFENVGGAILDAGLMTLNDKARVVLCGLISQYNCDPLPTKNLWQLIVKGARIEGFILTHYISRLGEAVPELTNWVREGKLRIDEHIEEGIEHALPAFLKLFEGTNEGKMILKLV
jgi:NADPH-dependent curcumin reductase CurA